MSNQTLIPISLANEYGQLHIGYDEDRKQHILWLDGACTDPDTLDISPELYSLMLKELV